MNAHRLLQIESNFRQSFSHYKTEGLELVAEIRRCHNVIESQKSHLNTYRACVALKFPPKVSLLKVVSK